MSPQIFTGCSGFYNRHWKGIFYPQDWPQRRWFEYYTSRLDALELNVTFYKFPTVEALGKWHNNSPPEFRFAVKAPRIITHFRKLRDCSSQFCDLYHACETGLKEKLAAILFQFPPGFLYTPENLEMMMNSFDLSLPHVVEFRHGSWWNREVFEALDARGITFCSTSHPGLPNTLIINQERIYVRLHGVPRMFYSAYERSELLSIATRLKNSQGKEAFIFFNNTAGNEGILNALEFKEITG